MKSGLMPLVVVLALVSSLHAQTKDKESSILAKYTPQRVDKADTSSVYTLDWFRFVSMKYHLTIRDSVPVHLRKMNSPFREVALLVRYQGITQEDMVVYKLFNRLPIHPSLHIDSLGRVFCDVFFFPSTPTADSAFINLLRGYGSQILEVVGPVAGRLLQVRGYFPICHLEDIAKRKEVNRVDKIVRAVFN